jgi:hypothetical protein
MFGCGTATPALDELVTISAHSREPRSAKPPCFSVRVEKSGRGYNFRGSRPGRRPSKERYPVIRWPPQLSGESSGSLHWAAVEHTARPGRAGAGLESSMIDGSTVGGRITATA